MAGNHLDQNQPISFPIMDRHVWHFSMFVELYTERAETRRISVGPLFPGVTNI